MVEGDDHHRCGREMRQTWRGEVQVLRSGIGQRSVPRRGFRAECRDRSHGTRRKGSIPKRDRRGRT
ncbi:hypothetical protein BD414DRAFT_485258 [Trametes punicea]|nr:hypothetical protein BD414DRAFT_485258 [Trametes punicea]